jgi:4-carboxymuconolactone decarboxylase
MVLQRRIASVERPGAVRIKRHARFGKAPAIALCINQVLRIRMPSIAAKHGRAAAAARRRSSAAGLGSSDKIAEVARLQGRNNMSKSELFEKGLKVRKEVLGEDYVNKSIAGADEFTRTMAEWSTEFCWGALWTRPGMDRRTRSIVNLAMLGALNRPHELKLHVKGALKNGLTKDEIKEILLQVAVYCGVPAGIDAFRNAREAFKELEGG